MSPETPPPNPTETDPAVTMEEAGPFEDVETAQKFVTSKLYPPSVTRVVAVVRNLVTLSGAADFAIWLPMAAIDTMLAELDLAADKLATKRLLRMMVITLRAFADRIETFLQSVDDDPPPKYPIWPKELTAKIYADVAAEYPEGTE